MFYQSRGSVRHEEEESDDWFGNEPFLNSSNFTQRKKMNNSLGKVTSYSSLDHSQRMNNNSNKRNSTRETYREPIVIQAKLTNRKTSTERMSKSTERKTRETESFRRSHTNLRSDNIYPQSDSNRFHSTGRKSCESNRMYNSTLATNSRDYSSVKDESRKGPKKIENKENQNKKLVGAGNIIKSSQSGSKLEAPNLLKEENNNSELMNRYAHLLKAYENLAKTSTELKESLRNEVIRNEEQRAYIEALKQSIRIDFENSGLLPIFRTIQEKMRYQFQFRKGDGSQSDEKINQEFENLLGPDYVDFFMKLVSGEKKEETSMKTGLLQNELRIANDKLMEVLSQNKILQSEINESEKRVEGANRETDQVKKALEIIHKENLHLNEEKKSLINYISEMQERPNRQMEVSGLDNMREELMKSNDQIEGYKQHSRELATKTRELEHQKMLLNRLLEEKITMVAELEKDKQDTSRILQNREELLNTKQSENVRLTIEQEGHLRAIKVYEGNMDSLLQNFANTQDELKQTKVLVENLERKLKEKESQEEIKNGGADIEELTKVANLNIENLKSENLLLVEEIMKLTEDMNEMAGSFKAAQKEVYDIKNKMIAKEEMIKKLTEKIGLLEKEKVDLDLDLEKSKKIEWMNISCQTSENLLGVENATENKNQEVFKFLQEELEGLSNLCLGHQTKQKQETSSSSSSLNDLKEEDKIKKQIEELKSRIIVLNENYKQLVQSMEEKDVQVDDIQKQIKKQIANVEKLNKELRLQKQEHKSLSEERDYLMNATIELDKQLTKVELKASSYENEIKIYKKSKSIPPSGNSSASKNPNQSQLIKILKGFIFNDKVIKRLDELENLINNPGSATNLDVHNSKKIEVEGKLSQLQLEERKRYESIEIIEKEVLDLKEQLQKFQNDLEMSNSDLHESIDLNDNQGNSEKKNRSSDLNTIKENQ